MGRCGRERCEGAAFQDKAGPGGGVGLRVVEVWMLAPHAPSHPPTHPDTPNPDSPPPGAPQVRAVFAQVRDRSWVDVDASGSVDDVHTRVRAPVPLPVRTRRRRAPLACARGCAWRALHL